jgi:hypothetical protein
MSHRARQDSSGQRPGMTSGRVEGRRSRLWAAGLGCVRLLLLAVAAGSAGCLTFARILVEAVLGRWAGAAVLLCEGLGASVQAGVQAGVQARASRRW